MTPTNGSFWALLPQLLYSLPTVLVAIAAVIVCTMNWQKAPTAARFCLIGSGLIGFNAIFGALVTFLMVQINLSPGSTGAAWTIITVVRVLLSVSGFVFMLIAVFSGRQPVIKENLFETATSHPLSPQ